MRRLTKLLLLLLSYSPIATVAVAAQAKANELEGETQTTQLQQQIKGARTRILPEWQMTSTMDAAKKRYAELTGLQGDELEQAMLKDLNNLAAAGLIEFDEKNIMAQGPSEHAGPGKK